MISSPSSAGISTLLRYPFLIFYIYYNIFFSECQNSYCIPRNEDRLGALTSIMSKRIICKPLCVVGRVGGECLPLASGIHYAEATGLEASMLQPASHYALAYILRQPLSQRGVYSETLDCVYRHRKRFYETVVI